MTRDEIIRMAIEAGCDSLTIPGVGKVVMCNGMRVTGLLERFAAIVSEAAAAAEREECAKACQGVVDGGQYDGWQQYAAAACRDEIRARSNVTN